MSAGVPAEKAQMAADSVRHEINERFAANFEALATKHDLAAAVADIQLAATKLSAKTDLAISQLSAKTEAAITQLAAKTEAAITQLAAKTDATILDLSSKTSTSFAKVDARFEQIDVRFERLETRLDKLEEKIDLKMDLKFESMLHRVSALIAQSRDISLRWTIGSMFALVACAGGVAKLFMR